MRMERIAHQSAWWFALLLGQASAILGLMIGLGWTLAFGLILSSRLGVGTAGVSYTLPFGPPLIGMAIGALALMIARWSCEPISRFAIAGLVFNAIPLALAIALALF